jgi:hypothetical protein
MTAAEVLAKVLEAGGRIAPDTNPPRLLVPPELKALVVEHRAELRVLVLNALSQPPAPPALAPGLDLIARYRAILERRWTFAGEADADLQDQARVCDELGPAFAEAVARLARREWVAREGRCPPCGAPGFEHDPDTGEAIPIVPLDAPARPRGPRDSSGWLVAIPGLGARRPGPLTLCALCGDGTLCRYGDTPLCRGCSDRWETA